MPDHLEPLCAFRRSIQYAESDIAFFTDANVIGERSALHSAAPSICKSRGLEHAVLQLLVVWWSQCVEVGVPLNIDRVFATETVFNEYLVEITIDDSTAARGPIPTKMALYSMLRHQCHKPGCRAGLVQGSSRISCLEM